MERFVRRVDDAVTWYCGAYTDLEHKQILERTATCDRFNRILHYSSISYPPHVVPGEAEVTARKSKHD